MKGGCFVKLQDYLLSQRHTAERTYKDVPNDETVVLLIQAIKDCQDIDLCLTIYRSIPDSMNKKRVAIPLTHLAEVCLGISKRKSKSVTNQIGYQLRRIKKHDFQLDDVFTAKMLGAHLIEIIFSKEIEQLNESKLGA